MNSHMPRFERDVMDRWDDGQGSIAIAAALGESPERVMKIVAQYAGGEGGAEHERVTRLAQIAGSARYVAAVAATGRGFA